MTNYKNSSYNKPKKISSPKEEKTRTFNGELKPLMSEADDVESWNDGTTELSSEAADLRTHEITEQWTLKRNTTRLKQQENGKTSVIPIPVNS